MTIVAQIKQMLTHSDAQRIKALIDSEPYSMRFGRDLRPYLWCERRDTDSVDNQLVTHAGSEKWSEFFLHNSLKTALCSRICWTVSGVSRKPLYCISLKALQETRTESFAVVAVFRV